MPLTASQTPQYPTTKSPITLAFTPTTGNFVRVWVTAAPLDSELDRKLKETRAVRLELFAGRTSDTLSLRLDKPGRYVLALQEYTKDSVTFSGGYEGDARAYPRETEVGTEQTFSVVVGSRLTAQVGVSPDTATLVCWVWDQTIRKTYTDTHGERSPALIKPRTDRARTAVEDAAVVAAVDALGDVTASAALGSLATIAAEMRTDIVAHMALLGGVHPAADAANPLGNGFIADTSATSLIECVAQIHARLRRHVLTDSGSGPGSGSWHTSSKADRANSLLTKQPTDVAGAVAALADIWRVYEAHRVNTGVHGSADNTNTLTALPQWLAVHKAYLAALAAHAPAAPATANPGAVTLVHGAGATQD